MDDRFYPSLGGARIDVEVATVKIEVRMQEPTFSMSEVRRLVSGRLPSREPGTRWTWPDVAVLLWTRHRQPIQSESAYLRCILSPDFRLCPWGLYLVGIPPHGVIAAEDAAKHGRASCEGFNNHVHLHSIAISTLDQFELGVRMVRSWIFAVRNLPSRPRRLTLYLTETSRRHWTVCLYSNAQARELDELDLRLGGEIVRRTAEEFLSWAFPAAPEIFEV